MLHTIKKALVMLVITTILATPATILAADTGEININTATKIELQEIKGVGPSMAEKIINYKEQHGQFHKISELCNIKGIGEKSLQKIAGQVCIK
ncbi:MAG: hypothetical protein B6I36_01565 [Desulfobacteraceae bacterium 4572_35.1]|nr:MAG: hypothetical protein B6I36_01565 [Desulfobacteraceae bacterium 4572_35.1]